MDDKQGGAASRRQQRPVETTTDHKFAKPTTTTETASFLLPISIAIFIVLITIIYLWRRSSKRGRSILIVGPCEAGKTAVFSRLVGGPVVKTVTSLVPNELEYEPRNRRPHLLIKDLPGHDRVQIKYWDSSKQLARGILCVIDAAGGNKGIRESADVLYRVLTDSTIFSGCRALYIFANKQDQPMSKGAKVIRSQLEKELTTLRMTKSAGLASTGGKDNRDRCMLGREDKDFDFDHVTNIKIEFGEGCCTTEDEKSLESLKTWLDNLA